MKHFKSYSIPTPNADKMPPLPGRSPTMAPNSSTRTILKNPPRFRQRPSALFSRLLVLSSTMKFPSISPCSSTSVSFLQTNHRAPTKHMTKPCGCSIMPPRTRAQPFTTLPVICLCTSTVTPLISLSQNPAVARAETTFSDRVLPIPQNPLLNPRPPMYHFSPCPKSCTM